MTTQNTQKTVKDPIVTISVCMPLPWAKILDAYRATEKYPPSRSKIFQTVMQEFLQTQVDEMPWLKDSLHAGEIVKEASSPLSENTLNRALSLVTKTVKPIAASCSAIPLKSHIQRWRARPKSAVGKALSPRESACSPR